MSCPGQAILGQNLTCTLQAYNGSNVPTDADALPTYSVYENTTNTAILTGTMAKLDDAGTAGLYAISLTISTANGFALWKSYSVRYATEIGGNAVAAVDNFNVVQSALSATTTTGALTTLANVLTYIGQASGDDDALITALIARATSAMEAYCGRTFTSTTYRQIYDGTGGPNLWVNQTPITAIQLLATGRMGAVSITNVNTDAWNAYANVDVTNLELVVNGGTNDGTDTLTLATYTLTTLVTAINALGTGWTAVLLDSTKATWEAAELLPVGGIGALDPDLTYLEVPNEIKTDFSFEGPSGRVHSHSMFPLGTDNIIIRYTAGEATTPADLEQICIDLVNTYYLSRERDTTVMEEKLGDHSVTYGDREGAGMSYRNIPKSLQMRLGPYKRFRMPI